MEILILFINLVVILEKFSKRTELILYTASYKKCMGEDKVSKKKKGNGTGKFRRQKVLEPEQSSQAEQDGMAVLIPRVVGILGSRYGSGKSKVNCYGVANMLGLPPDKTKQIFDGVAEQGGMEGTGKGNYFFQKNLDKACAAYVAQTQD